MSGPASDVASSLTYSMFDTCARSCSCSDALPSAVKPATRLFSTRSVASRSRGYSPRPAAVMRRRTMRRSSCGGLAHDDALLFQPIQHARHRARVVVQLAAQIRRDGRLAVGDRAQDWPLRRGEAEVAEFNIDRPEQPRARRRRSDSRCCLPPRRSRRCSSGGVRRAARLGINRARFAAMAVNIAA